MLNGRLSAVQEQHPGEVDWKGIVIPALPAIAAFGNFILSVGVVAVSARLMHDRPQNITFAEIREASSA